MSTNDIISRILTSIPNIEFTVGGQHVTMQPIPTKHGEWAATTTDGTRLLSIETNFHNLHGRILAYPLGTGHTKTHAFNVTSSYLHLKTEQGAATDVRDWLRDLTRKQLIRKQGTIKTLLDEAGHTEPETEQETP